MKKIIQFLLIIILLSVVALIVIGIFNPMGSRDKLISSVVNSYLSSKMPEYQALPADAPAFEERTYDHPLLNDTQEKTLYNLGVDTSKLPTDISDSMQKCFVDKLGQARANEIVAGSSPTEMEIYKTRDCLTQ